MTSLTQSLLARHTALADASRIANSLAKYAAEAAAAAQAEAHVAKEAYLEALAASAQPALLVASLATPQARIECRDAATAAWHDCEDTAFQICVHDALVALGFKVGYRRNHRFVWAFTVKAGSQQIVLEWDPMIDGFDYEDSTEDAEALSPAVADENDTEDPACSCGDKRGMGTDDNGACRDCGGCA